MNSIISRIFTPAFLITVIRYALGAFGAWLATKGYIDAGTWEVVAGAIITIAVALMGGADATKDKATVDGKVVAVNKLPAGVQSSLEAAVSVTKARSLWAMLFGK